MPAAAKGTDQERHFKALAMAAARAADDKKGEAITLFHTGPVSTLSDYTLLVSILSRPHMEAVEEIISRALKAGGNIAIHRDGRGSDRWRVLDYGGLIVHLLHPEAREFYALDRVLDEARKIRWQAPQKREKKRPAAKKPDRRKKRA